MASRLTKDERRDQLLSSAAELLLERGTSAITMEGVAARAGVSKALPYAHFANADELLLALYEREVEDIGRRVRRAMRGVEGFDEKVTAAVSAYFNVVEDRGALLATLLRATGATRQIEDETDEEGRPRRPIRPAEAWFAELYQQELGIAPETALVLAQLVLAALPGAVDAWTNRRAGRSQVESIYARFVAAGVRAVAEAETAVGAR
jgi:AcrR family transcriptional regulator